MQNYTEEEDLSRTNSKRKLANLENDIIPANECKGASRHRQNCSISSIISTSQKKGIKEAYGM